MNAKTTLVLIALIGVGLFALPQTTALFAGQHSFVNIDATGNQIDCNKCHGDVNMELTSGLSGTGAPHANFQCETCHRVRAGEASGDNAYSAITYTAVSPTTPTVTLKRTLITTERDMEARNVPVSMTGSATTAIIFAKTATMMSGVQVQNATGMKYSLSACYKSSAAAAVPAVLGSPMPVAVEVPCDAAENATTLLPPSPRTFQATSLYNSATAVSPLIANAPLDNNLTTQVGAFDASAVKFAFTGTQSTRSPYGWTFQQSVGGLKASDGTMFYGFNGAGSEVSNSGSMYHAASLVSCLECHGGEAPTGHHDAEYALCEQCHYAGGLNKGGLAGIMAGGFGLGVTANDNGSEEVHKAFVTNEDGVTVYEDGASNTACLACHTSVAVDITYNKPTTVKFNVDLSRTGGNSDFYNEVASGSTDTYSGGIPPTP